MEAFADPTISAIFCAIGGDDTIGILSYGTQVQLNCETKTITLLESAIENAD